MGRLDGFKYRDIIKKLKIFGFQFFRYGKGSHEIWINLETKIKVTIPRHNGDMPEGTLKAILRVAEIDVEEFINTK